MLLFDFNTEYGALWELPFLSFCCFFFILKNKATTCAILSLSAQLLPTAEEGQRVTSQTCGQHRTVVGCLISLSQPDS